MNVSHNRELGEETFKVKMSKILSKSSLNTLPSDIQVPQYNRDDIKVGIFHFGVGGFDRDEFLLSFLSYGKCRNEYSRFFRIFFNTLADKCGSSR